MLLPLKGWAKFKPPQRGEQTSCPDISKGDFLGKASPVMKLIQAEKPSTNSHEMARIQVTVSRRLVWF